MPYWPQYRWSELQASSSSTWLILHRLKQSISSIGCLAIIRLYFPSHLLTGFHPSPRSAPLLMCFRDIWFHLRRHTRLCKRRSIFIGLGESVSSWTGVSFQPGSCVRTVVLWSLTGIEAISLFLPQSVFLAVPFLFSFHHIKASQHEFPFHFHLESSILQWKTVQYHSIIIIIYAQSLPSSPLERTYCKLLSSVDENMHFMSKHNLIIILRQKVIKLHLCLTKWLTARQVTRQWLL